MEYTPLLFPLRQAEGSLSLAMWQRSKWSFVGSPLPAPLKFRRGRGKSTGSFYRKLNGGKTEVNQRNRLGMAQIYAEATLGVTSIPLDCNNSHHCIYQIAGNLKFETCYKNKLVRFFLSQTLPTKNIPQKNLQNFFFKCFFCIYNCIETS